jgi:DsbC/DsbD-like thiol-disulfide interchange protein
MEFRVTVGLGQDSADTTELDSRAGALQESLAGLPEGAGATVVVDVVKATAQLVLVVHADDALGAAQQALQASGRGLQQAGLSAPGTIVTLEAEAVPVPVSDHLLRPHPVRGGAGDS